MKKGTLTILFMVLLLTACGPVVPQAMRKEVDGSLSFEELFRDPEAHKGKVVLLGGEIIETKNLREETQIEVLQRPLAYDDSPRITDESKGRFLILHSGFLDGAVYQKGRRITVVATVRGRKVLPLGEREYAYPLVVDQFLHLWPRRSGYEPGWTIGVGIGGTIEIGK